MTTAQRLWDSDPFVSCQDSRPATMLGARPIGALRLVHLRRGLDRTHKSFQLFADAQFSKHPGPGFCQQGLVEPRLVTANTVRLSRRRCARLAICETNLSRPRSRAELRDPDSNATPAATTPVARVQEYPLFDDLLASCGDG